MKDKRSEFKTFENVIQYKQYFGHEEVNGYLDMKSFTYFLYKLHELLLSKRKIKVQVFASASNTPTVIYKNNVVLANQRAWSCKEAFISYITQCGIHLDLLEFLPIKSIVQKEEVNIKGSAINYQYVLITCY